jgi:lysylphosphatidylglycerol synthetase-like protein (DUF2156 family)
MTVDAGLGKLATRVLLYYVFTAGGLALIVYLFPESRQFLPLGGIDDLIRERIVDTIRDDGTVDFKSVSDRTVTLFIALIGTLVFVIPLTWVYSGTRPKSKQHQALVETMYLLPIVVASVVVLVQHSIALAFSLLGIVGAVRFRNSLKTPSDAVFVFAALAIGIAAGVSEIGVAAVASMVFALTVVGLRVFAVVDGD